MLPRNTITRDRTPLILRLAADNEYDAILDIQREAMEESEDYFVRTLAEFDADRPAARTKLASLNSDDRSLLLVAEVNRQVVGALDLYGSEYARTRHVAHFGVNVMKSHRGKGVGFALIETMVMWAIPHPTIEKLCITLFTNNTRAINICNRFGFRPEGRRHREYLVSPGRYLDALQLARWIK